MTLTTPKLLICTPSAALRGGVERIIESLGLGLPPRGIEVIVGLAQGARFHDADRYRREYPQLRCVDIDGTSGTREGRLRGLRRLLKEVDPDIVLVARIFDAYQAVGERKIAGSSVRLGVTIQAYEPDYIAELATYAEFVDFCVTSGQLVAQAVEKFTSLPADRIDSIPGGVARPLKPVDRRRAGEPLRLGYVGRLEDRQKRIFDLPELLVELRSRGIPFRCLVAGSGSDERELQRRLSSAGLESVVAFCGWLSPEELYRDVYPAIEVFLHFAEWEGITIAPREAMAHGAVAVVSDFRGRAEEAIFRHGETALVFPVGDTCRAADLVESLWRQPPEWERLSHAAAVSQDGIQSDEGALDRWAEVLKRSIASPKRTGKALPDFGWPPAGRLDRFLGASLAESIRGLAGRRFLHTEAGGEWPHCSGVVDPEVLRRVEEFGRRATSSTADQR